MVCTLPDIYHPHAKRANCFKAFSEMQALSFLSARVARAQKDVVYGDARVMLICFSRSLRKNTCVVVGAVCVIFLSARSATKFLTFVSAREARAQKKQMFAGVQQVSLVSTCVAREMSVSAIAVEA